MKNNFYYKGKYFENEKDFYEYTMKWTKEIVSEDSLNNMLEEFKKNVLKNLSLEFGIRNGDMNSSLLLAFYMLMENRKNLTECQENESATN